MRRYLSSGVLTSIFIKKSKDIYHRDANFDLKKQKENILKDMNRIIDVSKYDVEEHKDVIVLKLKLDFINENIHALLSEMNHLTTSAYFLKIFMIMMKLSRLILMILILKRNIQCYVQ